MVNFTHAARRSGKVRLSIATLATASCLVYPAVAAAQTQAASPADQQTQAASDATAPVPADIVVTGFRASLASAIRTKRDSAEVVDAINAQDIASFPDANLADSLQRIPGISIERDGGEGRDITVRGLGGNFSRTRFNGMETVSSTTGSTLGSVINRGRGFDYSVFASELFQSIVVHKTQSADVDEGSLGATVDLQTARPFDHPGFQAAFSAQGAYYDINNDLQPRLAGLVSKTFDNDRFGILLSAAYSKHVVQEDAYSDSSTDFSDLNSGFCPVVPGSMVTPVNPLIGSAPHPSQCAPAPGPYPGSTPEAYDTVNQPNVFVPRLPGYGRFLNRQTRLGITGSVQWRPSDHSLVTIDAAYSSLHQNKNDLATNPISLNRGLGTPPAGSGIDPALFAGRPNMKIREAQVDENGQLVYGVFDDTDFSVTNSKDVSTTRFYQVDVHIEQDLGDRGKLNVLYGQADSYFDDPYSRLVTFSRFDGDGFVYDARNSRKEPLLNYNFDATDPSNWSFQNGYDSIREFTNTIDNRLKNLKVDVQYKLTDSITARAGIAAKRFNFISTAQQRIASTTVNPSLPADTTIADISSQVSLADLGLPTGSTSSFIVPNIGKMMDLFGVDCLCQNQYGDWRIGSLGTGAQGNNRSVQEQDLSPYIQADFNFDLANGMVLRGNLGVRYAETWQRSQGYVGDGVLTVAKRHYGDWLPAINLALDITPKLTARIAASKVMSRPELGYLTPGGSIDTSHTPFGATVGNPNLDPYRATNFDAGLEWYFQHGAILAVDYFHKDLSSFVQQINSTTTYAAAGLPLSLLTPNQDPNTTTNITSYENTSGGTIDGVEVQYQQPFTFLPGFLKHFGAILNYTHISSNISYVLTTDASGPTLKAPLVDASPNAANATLYYEDSKLEARVSLAYRDEYIRQVPLRSGLADVAGGYGTTDIDASVSYKLTPHVTLTADAINLTNEPTSYWDGQDLRDQKVYSFTGRQFFFGARYKF